MNTKIYISLIALIMIGNSSCKDKAPAPTYGDTSNPVKVVVQSAAEEISASTITSSGKIEAVHNAKVSTRMMGYIEEVKVDLGEVVKKGQLLIRINNSDLEAKRGQITAGISEAKVALQNIEKDYNRFVILFKENSATQKELDDITAQFNMAKARLESAEQMKNEVNAQFSYTNIKSPISGVVTNKYISAGDIANPGMPLIEIESVDQFQLAALVPESEIANIKLHTKVDVQLKSIDTNIKGVVSEIGSSAKYTGGQFLVKVLLEDSGEKLLSGMYANVQFPVSKKESTTAVMIPAESIITKGELSGVYAVSQDNKALLRWLRLGKSIGNKVEVLSGLHPEEKYIVSAEGKLYNGAKVTIQ